jgi:hypothetical protein
VSVDVVERDHPACEDKRGARLRDDEPWPPPGVKEYTIQEHLLAVLDIAKADLRRRRIDGLENLIEYCNHVPHELWPPELVQFVLRRFKRTPDNRGHFKRPPHRLKSRRQDWWHFSRDPNRVAAHFAALYIAKLRRKSGKPKRYGPYKVQRADGSKDGIVLSAVRRAVNEINAHPAYARGVQRARVEAVKALVRHGRTKFPTSGLKW